MPGKKRRLLSNTPGGGGGSKGGKPEKGVAGTIPKGVLEKGVGLLEAKDFHSFEADTALKQMGLEERFGKKRADFIWEAFHGFMELPGRQGDTAKLLQRLERITGGHADAQNLIVEFTANLRKLPKIDF